MKLVFCPNYACSFDFENAPSCNVPLVCYIPYPSAVTMRIPFCLHPKSTSLPKTD